MPGILRQLIESKNFHSEYLFVCAEIENQVGLVASPGDISLNDAYLQWFHLVELVHASHQSGHARLAGTIAALITATSRQDFVRFKPKAGTVISLLAPIVCEYPNEVTAFAFGASIYSSIVQQKTGKQPGCGMTPGHLAQAAKELRRSPGQARAFRRLLRLKLPSGRR